MVSPIARFPETEPVHLAATITKRRVTVGSSAQIQISQFFQIGTDDLIRVDKNANFRNKEERKK
jgi:hypothetical protein